MNTSKIHTEFKELMNTSLARLAASHSHKNICMRVAAKVMCMCMYLKVIIKFLFRE